MFWIDVFIARVNFKCAQNVNIDFFLQAARLKITNMWRVIEKAKSAKFIAKIQFLNFKLEDKCLVQPPQ